MKKIILFVITFISTGILSAQPTDGLVGYFNCDGSLSNNGSENISATAFNTTYSTNNAEVPNTTILFNGTTSSYLSVTDNGYLDFTGDFSIAFAVYTPSLTLNQGFYDNGLNYGGCGIWYFSADNTLRFNFRNGSIGAVAALPANQWTVVGAVRSGSILKLYVNGVLVGSGTEGTSAISYPYTPVLGQMYFAGGSGNYNPVANGAKMDEFRFYDRALTDAEVLSLVSFTLPLKLLKFNGSLNNNEAILNWETTSELNTLSFQVERSAEGTNFTEIGTVASQNATGIHQYSFTDPNISSTGSDIVYYRLKQNDIDGHFTYSRIVALLINKNKTMVMLYPNPSNNEVNLSINCIQPEKTKWQIINGEGATVMQGQIALSKGSNNISIKANDLKSGMYYLIVKGNDVNERLKFVKQ